MNIYKFGRVTVCLCNGTILHFRRPTVCLAVCVCISSVHRSRSNKKFELMLTRRAKAYSSSGSVV